MSIKSATSTEAQNNFGYLLDEVQQDIRYVVERRGIPRAIIMGFNDFMMILDDDKERNRLKAVIKELQPHSNIGRVIKE